MNHFSDDLDPFTTDAVLDGTAPAPEAVLAHTLAALTVEPTAAELSGSSTAFSAIAAATSASAAAGSDTRFGRLTAKTAAASVAALMALGGVAAAAGVPVVQDLVPGLGDDEPELEALGDAEDGDVEVDVDVDDEDEGQEEGGAEEEGGSEGDVDLPVLDPEKDDESADPEDDVEAADGHGARVSEAAQSDCGKTDDVEGEEDGVGTDTDDALTVEDDDAVVEEDPEDDPYAEACATARNHGEYVSLVARDKDGDGVPDHGKETAPGQVKKQTEDTENSEGGSENAAPDTAADESPTRGNGNGNGHAKGKGKNGK